MEVQSTLTTETNTENQSMNEAAEQKQAMSNLIAERHEHTERMLEAGSDCV